MKKANKKLVKNQQVNNNGCQHVQLGGMAYYDDKQYFLFSPDSVNQGVVEAFRRHGVAQQRQDGTFDFVAAVSYTHLMVASDGTSKPVSHISLTRAIFISSSLSLNFLARTPKTGSRLSATKPTRRNWQENSRTTTMR